MVIPLIDAVEIDTSTLRYQGLHNGIKIWYTAAGDGVGLYFFDKPPDLPEKARSIEDFHRSLEKRYQEAGVESVEFELIEVDGYPAIHQIVKVPQEPTGRTYIASIIIPFRDCSYVVKIQCLERGTTGVREAVLLDRMISAGEVDLEKLAEGDWPELGFDNEEYDSEFPLHPLSRARREMRSIRSSIRVHPQLRSLPQFKLPSVSS